MTTSISISYQFGQLKFILTMNSILALGLFAALAVVCSADNYAATHYNGKYVFLGYFSGKTSHWYAVSYLMIYMYNYSLQNMCKLAKHYSQSSGNNRPSV